MPPASVNDPFLDTPDATPADCEIRARAWGKDKPTVGLVGKPKPKKVNLNPLQRRWFEREGWTYAHVEAVNAWGAVTVDLWNAWDWIAVRADVAGVLFVQTTELSHLSHRRKKILAAPETAVLIAAGNKAVIHAWHQPGGVGSRWEVRIEEIRG